MCEDVAGGSNLSGGEIICFRIIRRDLLARSHGPCGSLLSATPCSCLFRWLSFVDKVNLTAPREPTRWMMARPRKGTTRRQGRLGSCFPRGGEYDCTRDYWFVCPRRRITAGVAVWVSRGMARPAMGVRWGGEACAVAQPAAGRREQAVPSALV